ncbi:hypothetical protein [Bradyrhizobium sp. F1.13.3]|uniref:hypothetical protein n=1 Tax=Bradyrhizobium sp. F1.13.3 TaxID=3156351 RepID=UPI003393CB7E
MNQRRVTGSAKPPHHRNDPASALLPDIFVDPEDPLPRWRPTKVANAIVIALTHRPNEEKGEAT